MFHLELDCEDQDHDYDEEDMIETGGDVLLPKATKTASDASTQTLPPTQTRKRQPLHDESQSSATQTNQYQPQPSTTKGIYMYIHIYIYTYIHTYMHT